MHKQRQVRLGERKRATSAKPHDAPEDLAPVLGWGALPSTSTHSQIPRSTFQVSEGTPSPFQTSPPQADANNDRIQRQEDLIGIPRRQLFKNIQVPRRLPFRLLLKASVGALLPLSPLFLLPPPSLALWARLGHLARLPPNARCNSTPVPLLVHHLVDSACVRSFARLQARTNVSNRWVYAATPKLVGPIFAFVVWSHFSFSCPVSRPSTQLTCNEQAICVAQR